MELELIQRLAVATGIGLLVGVERGWWQREEQAGARTAGIRTYTLIGLLGGVFGAIARALTEPVAAAIVLAVGVLVFSGAFTLFRFRETQKDKSYGATTLVAAIGLFALGIYAVIGNEVVAAAAGVAVVSVLAARESLHGWIARVSWPELRAGIVLAAMTFLALPIIPDQSFGPFGGINPRQIWLLAVVLAGVSFLGYAAAKALGAERGLLAAAAAGGLVSSTAVTMTAARRAAAREADGRLLAASATLGSAVAFGRTLVLIGVLNQEVAARVVAPLLAGLTVAILIVLLLARRNLQGGAGGGFELRNPFSLQETIGLALLLGGVLFGTRAVGALFGPAAAIAANVVVGMGDTDSTTYAMSQLAPGQLTPAAAAVGILLAVAANNLFKFVAGAALGGRGFGLALALGLGAPTAAGAAVYFLLLGAAGAG